MSDLVIFHKQLGDTVLLEPVLRRRALATGEQVHLLCSPRLHPLLELMPHTQPAVGKRRWMPRRLWAYDWGGKTTRSAAFTFCREKHLLIPNREWVTRTHRAIFSDIHAEPYLDRYIARYFWDETPLEPDAPRAGFEPPVLDTPPPSWTRDGLCPEVPFVLFNPVSAWERKCYEPAKWATVLRGVREMGLRKVVMTGGVEPWHFQHLAEIAAAAAVELTDVSGQTTLQEFIHLVSRARLVLCVDGAAAHLARAFGVPSVTLFGPSYGWMWHFDEPRHAAVHASEFTDEHRPSAAVIPAERVLAAIRQVREASEIPPAHSSSAHLPASLREGLTGRLK
jgi:ADP-heptose:LPS heptosyltransferase